MKHSYDVIIVGAGSIGIPTAMALANSSLKILVLDSKSSPGQGDNKKAIGGVRATHSDPAKIMIAKRSLEIFSNWEIMHGDKIEWSMGGYLFPVYRNIEKNNLTSLFNIQHKFGLEINFINSNEVKKLVPGINSNNLLGGTFSPKDGLASPLLSINAFAKYALKNKTTFRFKEKVKRIILDKNKICSLETDKSKYFAPVIVDAAGAQSPDLCKMLGLDIQLIPDLHEAAITEPVGHLFKCMVVDLRDDIGSKNFYLYQNNYGQIIFCITPDPPIVGKNNYETSKFLPQACKRIINLIPSLHSVRVRRVWRGRYPMTPDGSPIVGWNSKIKGLFHATGMCGQGFMLGPGIGEFIARMITNTCSEADKIPKNFFSPQRSFSNKQETLK